MGSKLVNTDIAAIFTISKDTWTDINNIARWVLNQAEGQSISDKILVPANSKIVNVSGLEGSTLQSQLNGLQQQNPPALSTDYLAIFIEYHITNLKIHGYNLFNYYSSTKVVMHSQNWGSAQTDLTVIANNIAGYASESKQKFSKLHADLKNVKTISNVDAEIIKVLLSKFQTTTKDLVALAKADLNIVKESLDSINTFAQFLKNNSFLLPLMNITGLNLDSVNTVVTGIELVIGTYTTLVNNISELTKPGIDINNNFITGLEIENAISDWNKIEIEASSFISKIS